MPISSAVSYCSLPAGTGSIRQGGGPVLLYTGLAPVLKGDSRAFGHGGLGRFAVPTPGWCKCRLLNVSKGIQGVDGTCMRVFHTILFGI